MSGVAEEYLKLQEVGTWLGGSAVWAFLPVQKTQYRVEGN